MVLIAADHEQRRVVATVPSLTRWSAFHARVRAVIGASPGLTDYDWIIDDQGPMDDVEVGEMATTGEAFRAQGSPDTRTFTVVISTDRFFETWARVIDKHYGNRSHYAAPTLEAAVALLDQLAAGRNGCGATGAAGAERRRIP